MFRERLKAASEHVIAGRGRVERQLAVIAEREAAGQDTTFSRDLLTNLGEALLLAEDHLGLLRRELENHRKYDAMLSQTIEAVASSRAILAEVDRRLSPSPAAPSQSDEPPS